MKKKQIRALYNRALSLALAVSTTASLCLGVSGVTAAMEEQKRSEETAAETITGERHHHTFACYEEYELDCTENHSENEHRKSCYRYSGERICGLEDGDLHLHNAECEVAAKVLICEEDERYNSKEEDKISDEEPGTEESSKTEAEEDESSGAESIDGENPEDESRKGSASDDETSGNENAGGESAGNESAGDESAGNENAGDESARNESDGDESAGNENAGDESAGNESDGNASFKDESVTDESIGNENSGKETAGNESADNETNTEINKDNETEEDTVSKGEDKKPDFDQDKESSDSKDNIQEGTEETDPKEEPTEESKNDTDSREESTSGTVEENSENKEKETESEGNHKNDEGSSKDNTEDLEHNDDSADKDSAEVSGADKSSYEGNTRGNTDSGQWNSEEENLSGEEKNIDMAKSGNHSYSLFAANNRPQSSALFPCLYIGSPLNAFLDNLLADENTTINEDAIVGEPDKEYEGVNEKIKEIEEIGEAASQEEHQHSEECYKTIYKCRQGEEIMALEEDGVVQVSNGETLMEAIDDPNIGTIYLTGEKKEFSVSEKLIINRAVTIDLQGKTLTYSGTNKDVSMFEINGGILTIKDSANQQQDARQVSEKIVSEAGTAEYNENTGRLIYYVTECSVNLDGKSTSNTTRKYEYDLGTKNDNIGMIKCNGLNAAILINAGGQLIIDGGKITNTDGKHGIWVKNTAANTDTMESVTINGGYLVGNGNLEEFGGAIYMQAGKLYIKGGVIAQNKGKAGGGIRADANTEVNIEKGMIALNSSVHGGGGIYGSNATIKIENSANIIANSAGSEGGGILSYGTTSRFELWGGCVADNTAKTNGGGIYAANSQNNNFLGTNFKITNNSAENGGGIYISNAKIEFNGTKIFANSASADGGGVYFANINDSFISSNNIFIALNQSKDNTSNSVYPSEKISILKEGSNYFIEGIMQEVGTEETIHSFDELKSKIKEAENDVSNKHRILKLTQSIEATEPIEVNHGAVITLILDGKDIQGKDASGEDLFLVSGKGSSLTIRNKPLSEKEYIVKEEKEVFSYDAGKQGKFDETTNMLTYYVTKSKPVSELGTKEKTKTIETTYETTISLKSEENKVGTIQGNGKQAVLHSKNEGVLIIEGGIITGAKHGVILEQNSAMLMHGGFIVGCGSAVSSDTTTTVDDGNSSENGAGIYASGASGIQIFDGVIAGNTTPKRGGGVFSDGGKIEVRGGIIAANIAGNVGGGLCAQGSGSTIIIGNDIKNDNEELPSLVISGNTAKSIERPSDELEDHRQSRHYGGGGIFTDSYANLLILHNAYITNNRAEGTPGKGTEGILDGAGLGGGGVFSCGKIMMSGSFVTANYSDTSGGGIFSYSGKRDGNGNLLGAITLTGGIIAGNYAVCNEGGGLRIDNSGEIESKNDNKIYITNNRTNTTTNWGGGGIFNTSSATTTIQKVLIAENTAEGFGGGIAGCNHGTNQFFVNHGAGIFDNKANGKSEKLNAGDFSEYCKNEKKNFADCIDVRTPVIQDGEAEIGHHPMFISYSHGDSLPSYQDFYCSNISQVYGKMLGGGSAEWRGSGSNSNKNDKNPTAFPVEIAADDYVETSNLMGLTAHPSTTDKNTAKAAADIYITGNYSAAHGAGVMTNGTFKVGISENHSKGTLTLTKELRDIHGATINSASTQKFTFEIYLMDDAENNLLKGTYPYTKSPIDPVLDGSDGSGTITKMPAEVSLRPGQSLTISGLPNGSYQIIEKEDKNSPYEPQGQNNVKEGVIWADDGRTILFVNVPKASLRIEKILEDNSEADADNYLFGFTIYLKNADGQNLNGSYSYIKDPFHQDIDKGAEKGNITFTNGESEKIYLRHGQTFSLYGLPNHTSYDIIEASDDQYEAKDGGYIQSGIITNENIETAVFLNVRKPDNPDNPDNPDDPDDPKPEQPEDKKGSLIIKKELHDSEGNMMEIPHLFTFTLQLKDRTGKAVTGEYSYTKTPFDAQMDTQGPRGKLEFTENKATTISLRSGQSIRIEDLPEGTCQVIENMDVRYKSKDGTYEQKGEIKEDKETFLLFVNVDETKKPDNPDNPDKPDKPEESSSPENPKEPTTPDNPENPKEPTTPDNPENPKEPTTPDNPENPKEPTTPDNPENPKEPTTPDNPDNPQPPTTASPPGGGGGRRHNTPTASPQPTTAPVSETLPENNTEPGTESSPVPEPASEPGTGNPGINVPQYLTELPDPNDPESPDSVTIMEDDVPRTYIKVWDPETEEFVYLPEDEVPLAGMLPKTGDPFKKDLWRMMFILSLISTTVLLCLKKIENRRENEE